MSILNRVDLKDNNVMTDILSQSVLFETQLRCHLMFLKVVIFRNVAFTNLNTQKDITELKQKTGNLSGNGPLMFGPVIVWFGNGVVQ